MGLMKERETEKLEKVKKGTEDGFSLGIMWETPGLGKGRIEMGQIKE